ncbi:unnamed protein product [Closterium sp. Yama58-4]|nr:unnamed protein product [Closterium sp. Yama58-4]
MLLPRSPSKLQATKSAPRAALLCLVISIALSAPCAVRGAQGPAATSIAAALASASSSSPSQSFNVSLLVLNATGLLAKLPALAPLTLFAPTDAAWRAAFRALALPYLSGYIPFPGAAVGGETPGSPGSPGSSSGGTGGSDAANSSSPAQPTPAPGVVPAAGGVSGGVSAAMVPGLPQVDLPLPGVPDLPMPGIPGGSDGLNSTIPVDNITIPMPDVNMTMPNMTMPNMTMPDFNWTFPNLTDYNPLIFDPLLAALSAVFSGDGTPASLAALAKERPETLKALSELLAYHVATAALNAAAIAARFTAEAGNLTTVNGQGLWINYNKSESAALLNAYSPAQRALISEGISVGYDGTIYYPNGTTVAANGTVIFDPATSPISVDSEGNSYYANGTVISANGTVVSTNGSAIAIDGPGVPLPPTVSSPPSSGDGSVAPRGMAGAQMMMEPQPQAQPQPMLEPAPTMGGGPADMPPATTMPAPADVPPATATPAPADMPPNVLVDPIPGVMGGGGMGGGWGNWSAEEQQQWWGNATEWMNKAVPGLNVTATEYLAWLNASSYTWAAGSNSMWEQAGSDMKVSRVVRADLMDSAGIVVHGIDGVLFPHFRDLPVFDKGGAGGGGGAEGDVPMPIPMPVVAPGGVANDSADGAGTNGTATGGKPDDSAAGGAGAPAAAGSGSGSSSSSGGQDASKSAASGTPTPPAGSPPAGKSQSKAAAVPVLLTATLSLVALL